MHSLEKSRLLAPASLLNLGEDAIQNSQATDQEYKSKGDFLS